MSVTPWGQWPQLSVRPADRVLQIKRASAKSFSLLGRNVSRIGFDPVVYAAVGRGTQLYNLDESIAHSRMGDLKLENGEAITGVGPLGT